MEPYEVLKVRKNDTANVILKAYRKAVMKHHPDRGGDAGEFRRVQAAYELLSDPERRARYDATGDAAPPPLSPPRQRALAALAQTLQACVGECLSAGRRPCEQDLVNMTRAKLESHAIRLKAERRGPEGSVRELTALLGRFTAASGENDLEAAVRFDLANAEKVLAKIDEGSAVAAEALTELKRFTFRAEPRPHAPRVNPYGAADLAKMLEATGAKFQ